MNIIPLNTQQFVDTFLQWIDSIPPVLGFTVIVVALALCTLTFVSTTPLNLAAGLLFGVIGGTICVTLGCMLGAIIAFLLAKSVLRSWVLQKVQSFQSILNALEKQAFLIIFLTRLAPVSPFQMLNYAFGISGVNLWTYSIASTLGLIPNIALYCWFGMSVRSLSGEAGVDRVWIIVGLVVSVIAMFLITYVTKKAIQEAEKMK